LTSGPGLLDRWRHEQPPVDGPAAAGRRRTGPVSETAAQDAAGAGRGLGAGFARLWTAAAVSNVGDGVYVTALPLLAATLTRDPLGVSLVTFGEWLPWLLFGLVSGALLDRWDRRRVMWTVDAGRFAVVGGLAVTVLLDHASIALLAATGFLLGTGQTLVDTAQHSVVPALVSREPARLERANARLQGTQIVANQFVGPPVGGFLFSVAAWIPLAVDAVSFGASSALVAAIKGRFGRPPPPPGPAADGADTPVARRPSLRAEIAEGLRWLLAHRLLRALAVMVAMINLLGTAHDAILVLFAQERLGLGSVGFGLLLTGSAAGGVLGGVVAPWLSRRLGAATILLGGFVFQGAATLGVGLTSSPWVAGALLGVTGLVVVTFNVVGGSLRQTLTPDHLLGRVISTFRLFSYGAVPLGALLGGVVARAFGLRAPFLLAGVVAPVVALLCLPVVNRRSIAEARARAGG
jgi:MFS family permease